MGGWVFELGSHGAIIIVVVTIEIYTHFIDYYETLTTMVCQQEMGDK